MGGNPTDEALLCQLVKVAVEAASYGVPDPSQLVFSASRFDPASGSCVDQAFAVCGDTGRSHAHVQNDQQGPGLRRGSSSDPLGWRTSAVADELSTAVRYHYAITSRRDAAPSRVDGRSVDVPLVVINVVPWVDAPLEPSLFATQW